ncbi:MAG: chemotaxis protein CheA [Burkholderiaceae bacterium]
MNASTRDDDEQFLRDALPAFISESVELLDQIEQLLLELESSPADRELLDALFRCAHTIKGSAGLFGLDDIVAFTHHVETFLDAVREGQVSLNADTSRLLLSSGDQIRRLVSLLTSDDCDIADQREPLVNGLMQALGSARTDTAGTGAQTGSAHHEDATRNAAQAGKDEGMTDYRICLNFGKDTFRDGFDPLAILEYLATTGSIGSVEPDLERIPALEMLDAEDCHLNLVVMLSSAQDEATLAQAFELFREDCEVTIEPLADCAADLSVAPTVTAAHAPHVAQAAVASVTPAAAGTPAHERRRADDASFLKVRADRLDEVINLLGELVIAGAGTGLLAQRTGDSELIESAHQLGRLIEEIRNGTLQLRMVQIGETFGRFRRVVHDLAAELGKQVHLEIVGGDTELDKSVVERINDPLMHLVRNALDHGLETREQRLAAGKSEQGTLRIAASHDAGGP